MHTVSLPITDKGFALNIDVAAKLEPIRHDFTMSSDAMDSLILKILDADITNNENGSSIIELPSRLPVNVGYDDKLISQYQPKDIEWVKKLIDIPSDTYELAVLDSLTNWTYRNTGDLIRSAVGLIGAAIFSIGIENKSHDVENIELGQNPIQTLIGESNWVIRRLIRTATTIGAIDAKIPRRNYSKQFEYLEGIKSNDKKEVERQTRLLGTVTSTSNLNPSSMDDIDYIAGRLIQMVKSISEYKRVDEFGRLRSFLTNSVSLATLARVKAIGNHQFTRLCSDIIDMCHSLDRQLNANCIAANGIMERVFKGEVIYSEMLTLGRHQHRVMAIEYGNLLTLFSYLLKRIDLFLSNDGDVIRSLNRLMRFSGITDQYSHEVVEACYKND